MMALAPPATLASEPEELHQTARIGEALLHLWERNWSHFARTEANLVSGAPALAAEHLRGAAPNAPLVWFTDCTISSWEATKNDVYLSISYFVGLMCNMSAIVPA